jgi:SAM-dependent methyltransferase
VPERFSPEDPGPLPAYEHAHRYSLAASAVEEGSWVLDLACGSGYGSRILRAAGAVVVSLDVARAVLRGNAPAVCGTAECLPFSDASFDGVVCLEAIEHLAEPEYLVREVARVLRPEGFALLSTPERSIFTDRAGNRNPYHISEMDRDEFLTLLRGCFHRVVLRGQSVWAGSWIARLDERGEVPDATERRPRVMLDPLAHAEQAPWTATGERGFPTPLFVLAACSLSDTGARRLDERLDDESILHDPLQSVVGSYLGALRGLQDRDQQIEEFASHGAALMARLARAEDRVAELELHARNLEKLLAERETDLAGVRAHSANLEEAGQSQLAHAHNLEKLLAERETDLAGMRAHSANLEEQFARQERQVEALGGQVQSLEEAGQSHLAHAHNLERLLHERDAHMRELGIHAQNLEKLVEELRAHAANLTELATGQEEHRRNLERLVEAKTQQADELQRVIDRIQSSFRPIRWIGAE